MQNTRTLGYADPWISRPQTPLDLSLHARKRGLMIFRITIQFLNTKMHFSSKVMSLLRMAIVLRCSWVTVYGITPT